MQQKARRGNKTKQCESERSRCGQVLHGHGNLAMVHAKGIGCQQAMHGAKNRATKVKTQSRYHKNAR
jgi:hypothetical protein